MADEKPTEEPWKPKKSKEELEEELRLVEEDLADVWARVRELRRRIGEREDAPTDVEERSAQIALADEQEALASQLESRRDELLRILGRK